MVVWGRIPSPSPSTPHPNRERDRNPYPYPRLTKIQGSFILKVRRRKPDPDSPGEIGRGNARVLRHYHTQVCRRPWYRPAKVIEDLVGNQMIAPAFEFLLEFRGLEV